MARLIMCKWWFWPCNWSSWSDLVQNESHLCYQTTKCLKCNRTEIRIVARSR